MPALCTVCHHPERGAIDRKLIHGTSAPMVAKAYPPLLKDAINRHRQKHLRGSISRAVARRSAADDELLDDLLGQVTDAQARTLRLLDQAEETKKLTPAAMLLGQLRSNVELLAKLQGVLKDGGPTVQVAILNQSPEWQDL